MDGFVHTCMERPELPVSGTAIPWLLSSVWVDREWTRDREARTRRSKLSKVWRSGVLSGTRKCVRIWEIVSWSESILAIMAASKRLVVRSMYLHFLVSHLDALAVRSIMISARQLVRTYMPIHCSDIFIISWYI